MHVLQVCFRVPYPPHDGGAIAMYGVVAGLAAAGHRVTVLAANTPKHRQPADALAHLGPNVHLVAVDVDTNLSPWRALRNLLFSRLPYNVERFINEKLTAALVKILNQEPVDVIQFEGTFVAWYNERLAEEGLIPAGTATVLRTHNIEHTIWEMLAGRPGNPLKNWYLTKLAARLRRFEYQYLRRFDAVAAITAADAQRLRALGCPEPLVCIPAGVDLTQFQPDAATKAKPRTLFLIGSLNWLPNQEAVKWLLREIWPAVRAEMPDVELHIAGSGAPAALLQTPPANVFFHGFVASAPAFMQQYELMLVPLMSGGGMRVKIVEGMALGKAILSTSLGAEGIAGRDGENLLLRDGAPAWLDVLRAWHRGEVPVGSLGQQAAATAAALYDNRRVTEQFAALYARIRRPEAPPTL